METHAKNGFEGRRHDSERRTAIDPIGSAQTTEIAWKDLILKTMRPQAERRTTIYPSQWALSLEGNVDGSPTRARTWDLRINSLSRSAALSAT